MTSSLAEINENHYISKLKFFTFSNQISNEYEIRTNTDKIFESVSLQKALLKIDVEGFEMNVIEGSKRN